MNLKKKWEKKEVDADHGTMVTTHPARYTLQPYRREFRYAFFVTPFEGTEHHNITLPHNARGFCSPPDLKRVELEHEHIRIIKGCPNTSNVSARVWFAVPSASLRVSSIRGSMPSRVECNQVVD